MTESVGLSREPKVLWTNQTERRWRSPCPDCSGLEPPLEPFKALSSGPLPKNDAIFPSLVGLGHWLSTTARGDGGRWPGTELSQFNGVWRSLTPERGYRSRGVWRGEGVIPQIEDVHAATAGPSSLELVKARTRSSIDWREDRVDVLWAQTRGEQDTSTVDVVLRMLPWSKLLESVDPEVCATNCEERFENRLGVLFPYFLVKVPRGTSYF